MLAHIKDKHIPIEKCQSLIEFYKQNSKEAKPHRDTFGINLKGEILETVKKYLEPVSISLNNSVIDWSHLMFWPKHSFQNLHKDFTEADTTLTSITYLNDNFLGGITYFNDGTQFVPVQGRSVFFDGQYFNHGVSAVSQGERYVIATWYKKKEEDYKEQEKLKSYWPLKNFYKIKLNISNQEKDQIKLMLHNFKDTCDSTHTTTYKIIDVLKLPLLKNIKDQVEDALHKINLKLTNSWCQLYKKGDCHEPHTHTFSAYSGVIYIDGKGTDGTCFFDNYSGRTHREKFEANNLILFPSQIVHYVNNQENNNERIIISFNTEEK